MAKTKPKVIFLPDALVSIEETGIYIAEHGYPERAEKYADKMTGFGLSLAQFPDKYPVCKQNKFAKWNFRCAVFDRTYVFLYKVVKGELIIYNVIHGKRLK